jgi:hypothetical protein
MHGAVHQKVELYSTTAVRNSNATSPLKLFFSPDIPNAFVLLRNSCHLTQEGSFITAEYPSIRHLLQRDFYCSLFPARHVKINPQEKQTKHILPQN